MKILNEREVLRFHRTSF